MCSTALRVCWLGRADQDLPLQDVRSMELLKLIWGEKDGEGRISDDQRKGVRDSERDQARERER